MRYLLLAGMVVGGIIGSLFFFLICKFVIRVFKIFLKCACGHHDWVILDTREKIHQCRVCGSLVRGEVLTKREGKAKEDSQNASDGKGTGEGQKDLEGEEGKPGSTGLQDKEDMKKVGERVDNIRETIIDLLAELAIEREEYKEIWKRLRSE